ncbi:MAG: nucleoside phosphorylase [Ardenticatenaceae bacterium]|nr:nucleoside phosphorylase [Anaerolineales bacterium]MCB8922277.1 nucleoside phosphorylase [Ardenticatenaceae bacterium]MCB8990538.1 nucleoside phosphorylase [Ardenticatenaceae bacterium]
MTSRILPVTGLEVGAVSPAVLVCGDPARADKIAAHLDDARLLSERREYRAYRGIYRDVPITVCSHGIGAPGAALAFEELIVAGAKQIIRVGTCGALQESIQPGDLVVATAAVQHTGYGRETVPDGFPAVADPNVTAVLQRTARLDGTGYYSGIILTRDNFYAGVQTPHTPDYAALSAAGVQAVEMECAALFLVGSLRRVQTGAVLAVDGNVLHTGESIEEYAPHRQVVQDGVARGIRVALEALLMLAEDEANVAA